MPRSLSQQRSHFSVVSLLGVVCIALVLMSGIVQVAHSHPSGQPDHDCSLCITAHQVIQVVALVTLALSSVSVAGVAPEPILKRPGRYFFFKLASRPPPAVSATA
jgi:hypothetical protein